MPGTRDFDYLVVGGGLAAASAVDGIREVDPVGSIGLLTEESEPPYQRPPLSKEYLQYADTPRSLLYVKPEGWFAGQGGVELVTRQKALELDPASMIVTTNRGNLFRGSRILLATGGRARRLDIPGRDLAGVFTLRSVEDSEAIREAAIRGTRAVLVGAGFVGMEVAAALVSHGVEPTVVEPRDRVWAHVLPHVLSDWIRTHFEDRGVMFELGSSVRRFAGDDALESVVTEDRSIPCDLAVVGIGMQPCDGLAADAGLAVADGIQVDTYGETSHPHIYAAGDVARFPDPVFGGTTRVEHWEHAREHGRRVGRNMAGERDPYQALSYFFSRVFGLSLDVVGRPATADRTVMHGAPGQGPCVVFGVSEGRLNGAVLLNAPSEIENARRLVRARVPAEILDGERPESGLSLGEIVERAGGV